MFWKELVVNQMFTLTQSRITVFKFFKLESLPNTFYKPIPFYSAFLEKFSMPFTIIHEYSNFDSRSNISVVLWNRNFLPNQIKSLVTKLISVLKTQLEAF